MILMSIVYKFFIYNVNSIMGSFNDLPIIEFLTLI